MTFKGLIFIDQLTTGYNSSLINFLLIFLLLVLFPKSLSLGSLLLLIDFEVLLFFKSLLFKFPFLEESFVFLIFTGSLFLYFIWAVFIIDLPIIHLLLSLFILFILSKLYKFLLIFVEKIFYIWVISLLLI